MRYLSVYAASSFFKLNIYHALRMIYCKAIRGLPAMHITLDHKIYLTVDKDIHGDELTLEAVELAGFNIGEFKVMPTSAAAGVVHNLR